MFSVYIIQSIDTHRFYVGSATDVIVRLRQHNAGSVTSTKAYRPWALVYKEEFVTRTEARKRELQIKSYKGGRAFRQLVSRAGTQAVNGDRL